MANPCGMRSVFVTVSWGGLIRWPSSLILSKGQFLTSSSRWKNGLMVQYGRCRKKDLPVKASISILCTYHIHSISKETSCQATVSLHLCKLQTATNVTYPQLQTRPSSTCVAWRAVVKFPESFFSYVIHPPKTNGWIMEGTKMMGLGKGDSF